MNRTAGNIKGGGLGVKLGSKRKADISPSAAKKGDVKKRSALGDLTNAAKKTVNAIKGGKPNAATLKVLPAQQLKRKIPVPIVKEIIPLKDERENEPARVTRSRAKSLQLTKSTGKEKSVSSTVEAVEDSILYITAVQTPESDQLVKELNKRNLQLKNEATIVTELPPLPAGVVNFDEEHMDDPFQVSVYAQEIFQYYKRRELRFPVKKYLDMQSELNKNMRSILVDWMVEVQENFELNHETLYSAVRLVDMFLGKTKVQRDKLQLVGTTALYVSAKFDERSPPIIDDFCYICDDAYPQDSVLRMEETILRALNFDICMPLSYRFLRRYSRCGKIGIETLTLARFILEVCLMEYELIDARDSMMASSALLLALKLKNEGTWTPTLEYYSGYTLDDLFDLTHRIYNVVRNLPVHLKTIRSKYSHRIFFEVAKIPLPDELDL